MVEMVTQHPPRGASPAGPTLHPLHWGGGLPGFPQPSCQLAVAEGLRHLRRGAALIVHGGEAGLGSQQGVGHTRMAIPRGVVEGRVSVAVCRVEVRICIYELGCHCVLAILRGIVERGTTDNARDF